MIRHAAAILLLAGTTTAVLAEEAVTAPQPSPEAGRKTSKKAGKIRSVRDADGSVAPNRFEADAVIRSRYTLDGKPLEVDPD